MRLYEVKFQDEVLGNVAYAVEESGGSYLVVAEVEVPEVGVRKKVEMSRHDNQVDAYSLLFDLVGAEVRKGKTHLEPHLWKIREVALWYAKSRGLSEVAKYVLPLFFNPNKYGKGTR